MLKNVCGERLGRSLLKRMRKTEKPSARGWRRASSENLQSIKRLFSRLKKVERVVQKVVISRMRRAHRRIQPSVFHQQLFEGLTARAIAWLKMDQVVSHRLSMKNDTLKKVLRVHQKRTLDDEGPNKAMCKNLRSREVMATGSAIVSLFSFLSYAFDTRVASLRKRVCEIEDTFRIFSFNGVENV